MPKRVYIDLNPLLNSTAWFKEAITTKGDGKTTALIKTAIQSRQDTGLTPVFCRRWGTEMGDQFKRDVLKKIERFCPEVWEAHNLIWQGSLKKGGLYLLDKDDKSLAPFMHAFPLSMIGKMKSGLDVETHRNIYIDEYIPLDGRYLPHEVTDILDLYQTVDRDMIKEVSPYLNYVIVCGNKIGSIPAPDLFFKIDHDYTKNALTLYKDGAFAILSYGNRGNIEALKQSPFEKLIADTEYAEYAHGGQLRGVKPQIWAKKLPATQVLIKGEDAYAVCAFDMNGGIVLAACSNPDNVALSIPHLTTNPTDNSGYVWIKAVKKLSGLIRPAFINGKVYYVDKFSADALKSIVTYLSKL